MRFIHRDDEAQPADIFQEKFFSGFARSLFCQLWRAVYTTSTGTPPPSPLIFGIIELAENSPQNT
jgi:hypothetical protein